MLANCPFNPQCVFITGITKRSLLSNTYATQLRTKTRSRYDQASSGNNESRYHQAAPAQYDFPVFPVVSEACHLGVLDLPLRPLLLEALGAHVFQDVLLDRVWGPFLESPNN